MRFLIFASGFLLFCFSSGSEASLMNWPTALIHYPQAALDYFEQTQKHPSKMGVSKKPVRGLLHSHIKHILGHKIRYPRSCVPVTEMKYSYCECQEKFKNEDKFARERACWYYLVDAISFSLPSDSTDYVTDDFETLIEQTYDAGDQYIEKFSFAALGRQFETSARMCIAQDGEVPWAISAGQLEGISFVYNQPVNSPEFKLFGLLEEMPDILPGLAEQQVESLYVTGELIPPKDGVPLSVPGLKNTRSFCDLSKFERFRLCAVSYLALKNSQNTTQHPEGNYIDSKILVDEKSSYCTNDTVIVSLEIENKRSLADILNCAINNDLKGAESFFLTSDPFSTDSAFLVDRKGTSEFRLVSHMSNIRVLKQFV